MKSFFVVLFISSLCLAGKLSPSIYFTVTANEDKDDCSTRHKLLDAKGLVLTKACKKFYKACVLEGACLENKKNGETALYNYIATIHGVPRFMIVDSNQCPHGLGVKGICLDPFYSLASDLNHHKPGDVIYIEKLKGITLPDGSIHDGYMIVRDRGGAIHGPNRFDFFTGSYTNTDPQNSFAAIGLAAKKNSFQYVKITGEKAEAIRKLRHFPLVPN